MDTPDVAVSHPNGKPDLFSKVGPLPAWAWGAIVVVAFLAYRRFGGKTAAAVDPNNAVVTTPDTAMSDGSSGGGGSDPSSVGYNYGDVLAGNYTGTTTGAVFSTNQQWGVYAINNLPKMGYSAGEVTSAITFYLAGLPLTSSQQTIIGAAISNFGSPPAPMPLLPGNPITNPVSVPVGANPVPATVSYVSPTYSPTQDTAVPVTVGSTAYDPGILSAAPSGSTFAGGYFLPVGQDPAPGMDAVRHGYADGTYQWYVNS